jgi:hypothetical protein
MAKDAGTLSVGAKQRAKNRAIPTYAKAADLCATVKKGGKAQGTIVDYTGCLRRADEWLPGQLALLRQDRDIVVDEIAKECGPSNVPLPPGIPDLPKNAEGCFCIPMKCTPYMICLFLISKCVTLAEPKGDSVLKSIQAAFVWKFELLCVCLCPWSTVLHKNILKSDADRYHHDTRWSYDEALPEAQAAWGCPTKSGIVEQTCTAIKNIIALHKAPQRHARAMSPKDMDVIYNWSLEQCPNFKALIPPTSPVPVAAHKLITLHLYWQVFSSSAFVLWTRCGVCITHYIC